MATREELESAAEKLFLGIKLKEQTAKNAIKNKKFRDELVTIIKEAGAEDGCSEGQGVILYTVTSKYPPNAKVHRKQFLQDFVSTGKIKSIAQLEGACAYLSQLGGEALDVAALEEAAGVGIQVTPEQVREAVALVVKKEEARLLEERYHANLNILLGAVRGSLKWAEVADIKAELDSQVAQLLGPKTEADLVKPDKKKGKPKKEAAEKSAATVAGAPEENGSAQPPQEESWRTADPYAFFPKPNQNNQVHTTVAFSDGSSMAIANRTDQLQEHLRVTGGRVITRFPPEPNGYLHIGHAKAMFIDFGMAERYNGECILRYDDTNPEAEKQEYIDHIQDIISWLGWKPSKITYSSDYFEELYQLAVKLIKSGHAYVDHQTADEIKQYREERRGSPWRDRPPEESLALFEDMRRGLIDKGKATLRMRMDPKNDNYNMYDLIAYRIKFAEHPHAGRGWCIYPSYDYTHCIVDSLENITHSLCTLEFESRRASYFWLLEVLDLYKPVVWEYSRLNITNNVLSKRKLNKLVTDGYVKGWDDPRLLTLAGLRRRGVTPAAINNFCLEMGITRNETEIPLHKLEYHIRADAEAGAPRSLAVLNPLRLILTNFPADAVQSVECRVWPGVKEADKAAETYSVPLSRVVYIEASDFQLEDKKDYYGLAPNKTVLLKYAATVTCTGYRQEGGRVTEVQADFKPLTPGEKPPKGVLNWVAQPQPGQDPPHMEARLYDTLFKSASVGDLGDAWLNDLNPASLTTVTTAFANPVLASSSVGSRFQLERLGYFCVDPDSRPDRLVLNRTCTLRDTFQKAAAKSKP
eukprot:jgi/Botrbrau1/10756/Bobra.180_2s0021.1